MKGHLCKICDKNFGTKEALLMHKKAKHSESFKEPLFSTTQFKKVRKYTLLIMIILAISGFVYWKSIPPKNAPLLEFETTSYNFGTVSQANGIVSSEIQIRNDGNKPLIINKMDTSCMCTSASIISNGEEGPKFGMEMHGTNPTNWDQVILPGESAQLKIYYDPNAHKDLIGPVTRTINIYSNDPRSSTKTVSIRLNQVR